MTQIARVYDNSKSATDAVNELKNRGIGDVAVVSAPQNRAGRPTSSDDIVTSIKKAGFKASYADNYAERVKRGGAVVIVNAPFGAATKATEILNRHGPSKTAGSAQAEWTGLRERGKIGSDATAAPLSSALHMPLLTESSTFSSVTRPRTLSSFLGIPELVNSDSFFSGFPLKSRSQEPFSSLTESQQPFSSLASSQEPFSSLSGNQEASATLINNPAPLSSMLGLPVLLRDRHAKRNG